MVSGGMTYKIINFIVLLLIKKITIIRVYKVLKILLFI